MRMITLAIIASITIAFVAEAYWNSAGFSVDDRSASVNVRLD